MSSNFKIGEIWISSNKDKYRILEVDYSPTRKGLYPILTEHQRTGELYPSDEEGYLYILRKKLDIKLTHRIKDNFGVTEIEHKASVNVLKTYNEIAAKTIKSSIIRLNSETVRRDAVKEQFQAREQEDAQDRVDTLEDKIDVLESKLNRLYAKVIEPKPKLTYQKLVPEAKIFKKHNSDTCFDVFATSMSIEESYIEYGTGIRFDIPEGYYLKVYPRSSVSVTPLVLANSVGVVDEAYRNEVFLRFKALSSYNSRPYKVGDRIGQIELVKKVEFLIEEVENIDTNTERGTGGFGSTGSN